MVSTFTPNIQLEEPARGDDVGTWDTPVNNNMTLIDLVCGANTTISLNNSNVVLAAAQYECKEITFNSTLTGSVTITFPSSFKKSYEIYHTCTGSSAFTITLATTAAGGQAVCCPPGEIVDVVNDGTNIRFKNLGRVGSYWLHGGSSVPNWVSGCTVPPYLYCNGGTFSAATYPALATVLGSTTLPDSRGRVRANINDGTSRMLSSNGGVDGNTNFAAGGADTQTLTLAQLPTGIQTGGIVTVFINGTSNDVLPFGVSPTTITGVNANVTGGTQTVPAISAGTWSGTNSITGNNTLTSINTSGSAHTIMQPTYVGGITMIRAA